NKCPWWPPRRRKSRPPSHPAGQPSASGDPFPSGGACLEERYSSRFPSLRSCHQIRRHRNTPHSGLCSQIENRIKKRPGASLARAFGCLAGSSLVHFGHVFPVYEIIQEGLEIIRTAVA